MARYPIGKASDFPQGKIKTVKAGDVTVAVVGTPEGVCAVANRCAHLPLPISGGKVEGTTITCPWHNSDFDVCTGENLDWVRGLAGIELPGWSRSLMKLGIDPKPLTTYPVTEDDGTLYVEI